MRILIDGMNLSLKTGTGVATYARNLCRVVREAGHHVDVLFGEPFGYHRDPIFRELAFFDAEFPPRWSDRFGRQIRAALHGGRTAKPFPVPIEGKVIATQFASRLPDADGIWNAKQLFYDADTAFARRLRFSRRFNRVENTTQSDIAHWTYPIPLRLKGAANIYTIHDLVPLRLPFTTLDRKRVYYRLVEQICRTADGIVTVSETSRNDILNLFDVDPSKVINTYQSVEIPSKLLNSSVEQLEGELRGLYGISYKKYILYYGAIEPKKNVGRLIEAYLSSNLDIPLLIVGKDGWLSKEELRLIDVEGPSAGERPQLQRVHRVSYVSFPQLVNLIRGARLVAAPSLYEGFCLPILEAMLCGTAVLTSNIGATAEIAGDAALLVDPYDVRSIRDGLTRLSGEKVNTDYVELGRRRTRLFSEGLFLRKLGDVYTTIGKHHSGGH